MIRFARRIVALGALAGFALVAAWLLWADRGGPVGGRIMYRLIDLGRSIEAHTAIDIIDRSDIPATIDQVGHVLLWAVGMVIIGSVQLGRRPLVRVAGEVALLSMLSELAQPFVSAGRAFQPTDIAANFIGVAIGTIALVMLAGTVRLVRR